MVKTSRSNINYIGFVIFLSLFVILITVLDFSNITTDHREGNKIEYLICFVIMNITFVYSFFNQNKVKIKYTTWFFFLLFCIFGFYDSDYFSLGVGFKLGLKDFRDPLYESILKISLKSYSFFRAIVWGGALYLFWRTLKEYKINPNIGIYILSLLYITMFAQPRAILGMSAYFYAFSILTSPKKINDNKKILIGLLFILAFLAHRSLVIPILLTPLYHLRLNKKILFLILLLIPGFSIFLNFFMSEILKIGENSVIDAAAKYTNYQFVYDYNLKFLIITYLKRIGLYLPLIFVIWKLYRKNSKHKLEKQYISLLNISIYLAIIASLFLFAGRTSMGYDIIGYRYLYMIGVPLVIILSKLRQNKELSFSTLNFLLFPEFLASEAFIIGKLLSHNIM